MFSLNNSSVFIPIAKQDIIPLPSTSTMSSFAFTSPTALRLSPGFQWNVRHNNNACRNTNSQKLAITTKTKQSLRHVPTSMTGNDKDVDNTNNNDIKMSMNRRSFMATALGLTLGALVSDSNSNKAALAAKSNLTGDYTQDATTVLADMRTACDLARGTPGMADTVARTRAEMNDFVALYRRNTKVSGSTSFSTLYTAINTLSGHYASYGNAYPVPEKRKKRLAQQFTDIDRALNRGR